MVYGYVYVGRFVENKYEGLVLDFYEIFKVYDFRSVVIVVKFFFCGYYIFVFIECIFFKKILFFFLSS